MDVFKLKQETIEEAASPAAEVLRAGGVVLYPTDTLYGLGADALSDEAIAKIYSVKERNEGKPIHALVSSIEMAERYCEMTDTARKLGRELPKGKVTFILKKRPEFNTGILKNIPTFGFRIPDNKFCLALVAAFGGPITATSANLAGQTPQRSVDAIFAQLGEKAKDIVLVVDAGELPERQPSTVVDLSGAEPVVLREGAISAALLHQLLATSTTQR